MKKNYKEKPFEFLRPKDGTEYSPEIIKNWYWARAFVLDKLKDVAYTPDSKDHLHVVVLGDSELMLSVVRQLALSAHYVNYVEYDEYDDLKCDHRTVITIVSDRDDIKDKLCQEEYLYKLMEHCKYSLNGKVENADSYIDIELNIVKKGTAIHDENAKRITEDDVKGFVNLHIQEDICCIDTRKAVWASRMYGLGDLIGNLPAEDIHCAHRYALALNVFQYKLLQDEWRPLVNESDWAKSQANVKRDLSNVFCADCFESRYLAIKRYCEEKKMSETEAWEKNNEALSISEHERWVVEKLIMGFSPLDKDERIKDERLFGNAKKQYRKALKCHQKESGTPHIDLCSYRDLRRVNPDDMTYDSFLMLAIPKILEKLGKDKR